MKEVLKKLENIFFPLTKGYQESYFQKSDSHITVTEESVLLPVKPLSQQGFALGKISLATTLELDIPCFRGQEYNISSLYRGHGSV